jgi:pimeloyl-ACP methyl ester carboxylesterase
MTKPEKSMTGGKQEIVRNLYGLAFEERASFKDTYGGEAGHVFLECVQVRPRDRDSKTVIVFSHPVGGGAFLPIMSALARAGHHVVYVNTRYRGNDSALIMEKCVVDLGAAIRDAKRRFGYERIVLGGWSGGGSLALFYQEQAVRPTITATPAGDAVDLAGAGLVPGDAIFLVAAHLSRAVTLTEWIDASILDEADPSRRDPELDLYGNPPRHEPPYGVAFVERYRTAQIARNGRITAWVRDALDELRKRGRPNDERGFVVHGTMADPRWLDASLEPNGRKPGLCYLGDPRVVNDGPVGLARFSTLRSWLSQWSFEESRANGERNAASVSVPTLVVANGADDAVPPSHMQRLYAAISHADKAMHEVAGASHYYLGQPAELAECVEIFSRWLAAREDDR